MRPVTIARNYAEALLVLATEAGGAEAWGELLDVTAAAMSTPSIEAALMSPRVPRDVKVKILRDALQDAPHTFSLWVAAVVRRGRQMLMGQIADEYRALVDTRMNRVRAGITVGRDVDALMRQVIVERLSNAIGKQVIAGFVTDPAILGGVIIRIGDRVYDGSARRKLKALRQRLLAG